MISKLSVIVTFDTNVPEMYEEETLEKLQLRYLRLLNSVILATSMPLINFEVAIEQID